MGGIISELGGVLYKGHEQVFMHRETGERKKFFMPDQPVHDGDQAMVYVGLKDERLSQPFVNGGIDTREWTLTPEDFEAAEREGRENAAKDKAESAAREQKQLTETWGDFAKQRGVKMSDLFPSVFLD